MTTRKTKKLSVVLATVLLLASCLPCQPITLGKPLNSNYNLLKDEVIQIGLSEHFLITNDGQKVRYDLGTTNTFLSIQGLSNKIQQGEIAGSTIQSCTDYTMIRYKGTYIALCDNGKSIYQIRVQETGKDSKGQPQFKNPEFFRKKSTNELVKYDIPVKQGETFGECFNLSSAELKFEYETFKVSCKYASGKLLHLIFSAKSMGHFEEGITFKGPTAEDLIVFTQDDNA
jgi:hypothetical protein